MVSVVSVEVTNIHGKIGTKQILELIRGCRIRIQNGTWPVQNRVNQAHHISSPILCNKTAICLVQSQGYPGMLWKHVPFCAFVHIVKGPMGNLARKRFFGSIRGCHIHVHWVQLVISRQYTDLFREVFRDGSFGMGLLLFVHDGVENYGEIGQCDMTFSCSLVM